MIVAAGGFDTSGTVKLYRCDTPKVPITWNGPNGYAM